MTTLDDTCRCHCGLHLFDARTGTPAYARHIAHVEAFRAEVQRQIDQALAEWGLPSATTGPCARGVGGRRSQCKQCNAAAVKARYVPRCIHPSR
jgi:hypothetical protein